MKSVLRVFLFVFGAFLMTVGCQSLQQAPNSYTASPQQESGRFRNKVPRTPFGLVNTASAVWRTLTQKSNAAVPSSNIPIVQLDAAALATAPDASTFRLGHSTVLLKLEGQFWLTDPVFSERASPVQWAGPKRFHPAPIDIDALPHLAAIVLSHDHFDHLDHDTILRLAPKVDVFVTPLGVGDRLIAWGVDPSKVRQLDWWQETTVARLRLAAVPAQHFSGRGLTDTDRTLWASWVFLTSDLRLFFSGDTGYHADFKAIGERFGPFDVTFIETGAYDAQWPEVHMQPEETIQAHIDLKGKWLVPIHNGTFDLALHSWHEPFERISALGDAKGVQLALPMMGERLSLREPTSGQRWWSALKGIQEARMEQAR